MDMLVYRKTNLKTTIYGENVKFKSTCDAIVSHLLSFFLTVLYIDWILVRIPECKCKMLKEYVKNEVHPSMSLIFV